MTGETGPIESYCSGAILVVRRKRDQMVYGLDGVMVEMVAPRTFVIVDDRHLNHARLEPISYEAAQALAPAAVAAAYAGVTAARAGENEEDKLAHERRPHRKRAGSNRPGRARLKGQSARRRRAAA